MNKLTKTLLFCFAALVLSLFTTNSASACVGGPSYIDKYGNMISTTAKCYNVIKLPPEELQPVVKVQDAFNYMTEANLISVVNKNTDFNPAQYNQLNNLNSLEKIGVNASKYDLSNIVDNRHLNNLAADNTEYKYSMLKSDSYDIYLQPKDSAVRADRIAKDDNGDILILNSFDNNAKVSAYYNQEAKQL